MKIARWVSVLIILIFGAAIVTQSNRTGTAEFIPPSQTSQSAQRSPQARLIPSAEAFKEIRSGLKDRTPVLTFHDIIPRRDSRSLWFDCTVEELRDQMDWLKAHGANFISLDQLHRHLTQGTKLPPRAIAVTFADNYLGFYKLGFPLLKTMAIPVTMFAHTAMVGKQTGRPKASWTQMLEMQRSGLVAFGSQTVSHPEDIRTLSDAQLDREMAESRRELVAHLGGSIPYVAYPNGKWDQRSVAAARRAGYLMGFTEELRPAETASSILAVPRYVHTKFRQAWRQVGR
jgi:peptidoglycan/xylan/chitin deacetylase (PgdA/CDA1 family)